MDTNQRAILASLYQVMHTHLDHGIIPFWRDRALDQEYGGYQTHFDELGVAQPQPEKYLNMQARMLWWFSRLSRAYPDNTLYPALATHGADFLIDALWDEQYGGWRWKVARDGSPIDDGKVVYGQSFAIYALAEYARATADPRALPCAATTFDLLQMYAADPECGGYYENFERDWMIAAAGFAGGDRKSLDTHMHLMEAFTALVAASNAETHKRKLYDVVALIAKYMIDPVSGCGLNQFDPTWQSVPAIAIRRTWNAERSGDAPTQPIETTSYGHNTELAWLMRLAVQTLNADATPYLSLWRGLLDHAVVHGVDWEVGGIFRDGLPTGGPVVLEKEFWQHAESLVGFLDGYELFGDTRYLDATACIWQFVNRHMIVHPLGEWRILLDRAGQALDANVGNNWKGAYHTGRAMLECCERLERLLVPRTSTSSDIEPLSISKHRTS